MKINDLLFSSLMPAVSKSQPQGAAGFAQCLKEVLTSANQGAQGPAAASQVNLDGISSLLDKPLQALEDTLSHLEQFQAGLGSLDTSLKSLEPYVQTLQKDVSQLNNWVQSLPADSPLRSLLDEAATLSASTSFKFQRGDFV